MNIIFHILFFSAFKRNTLPDSTLKKADWARIQVYAGNAGQRAARAWRAFVLLALFFASVTVLQQWVFTAAYFLPMYPCAGTTWKIFKDCLRNCGFWKVVQRFSLTAFLSCDALDFDTFICTTLTKFWSSFMTENLEGSALLWRYWCCSHCVEARAQARAIRKLNLTCAWQWEESRWPLIVQPSIHLHRHVLKP